MRPRDPGALIVLFQGTLIPRILAGPEQAAASILAAIAVANLAVAGRASTEAGIASVALALYTILANLPGTGPWLGDLLVVMLAAAVAASGRDPLAGLEDPWGYMAGAIAGVGAAIILGAPSLAYPAVAPALERMLRSAGDGWVLVASIALSPLYPGLVSGVYAILAARIPPRLAGYDAALRPYVEWLGGLVGA